MTGIVAIQHINWMLRLEQGYAPPLISMFAVLVAAIGTFSGVFFGWRKDRREARDAALNAQELELRIKELESTLGSVACETGPDK